MTALLLLVSMIASDNKIEWTIPADATNVSRDGDVVVVEGLAGPSMTQVINLSHVNAASHIYMLTGEIKYEAVEGIGYLEMWSYFKDGGMFFTRTLGVGGPMGQITGTSHWRELQLPFMSKPGYLPERITVAVVLPGKGKVWIKPLTLKSISESSIYLSWGASVVSGSLVLLSIPVLIMLAFVKSTRQFSITAAILVLVLGCVLLTTGVVGWKLEWPILAAQSFIVSGLVLIIATFIFIPTMRMIVAKDELRTMRAIDADIV